MDHQVQAGQDSGDNFQLDASVVRPDPQEPSLPSAVVVVVGSVVSMTHRAWARPMRCFRLDWVQASSSPPHCRTENRRGASGPGGPFRATTPLCAQTQPGSLSPLAWPDGRAVGSPAGEAGGKGGAILEWRPRH